MKNQALFSLKDKSKKLKCHLLQFLFGALRVRSSMVLVCTVYTGQFSHIGGHCLTLNDGQVSVIC